MKFFPFPLALVFAFFLLHCPLSAQAQSAREQILLDNDWRFSLGHQYDTQKDFEHATGYFSYLTKTGFGDGPAAVKFDDRAWQKIDLPHDWAVAQPFSEKASYSHGFKTAGKGYPDKNIGWYRKKITIPEGDLGRSITLKFEGVFRNSKVFFNGYYLGTHESGYTGFEYDVTSYVDYGGENTIVVRADAAMEEGWYYEGAGIYRHVYLQKTAALHVANNGSYVTTAVNGKNATVTATVTVENKSTQKGAFELQQTLIDATGKVVATATQQAEAPDYYTQKNYKATFEVPNAQLWDIDSPTLYRLRTQIKQNQVVVDQYDTPFGIRTIAFDAERGFFLNGKSVKLKGTNNHQDHAGIGTALPDALQYYRIKKLKEMGSNAYRCSHHPPTTALLQACDELGMLVIDETRLMGTNHYHLNDLKQLIERDRNHPSVICWSVGNEEWQIEGNIVGERITQVMQDYSKQLDPTRPVTVGISSGFKSGISSMVEIMGYNYMGNGDIDAHRNAFKHQPGLGSEEGSTFATRGVYVTDDALHYKSAYDKKPRPTFFSIEEGWNFYAKRPYLAGMFIWTGFDYRGEPTPYGWPSVTSYFGMMDGCGFAKDNVFYLKSWWGTAPVLHLLPHWNWQGKTGELIDVWAYSNCDEVELFLNKKSLGKKAMPVLGHLEWKVAYEPGTLEAIGYKAGKKIMTAVQKTTADPAAIQLTIDAENINGDAVQVITASVTDKNGLKVPTADNALSFSIQGGTILGVGNGNPTSLEPDQFIDEINATALSNLQEQALTSAHLPQQVPQVPESDWKAAFTTRDSKKVAPAYMVRGQFEYANPKAKDKIRFFYKKIGVNEVVFVNGHKLTPSAEDALCYEIDSKLLQVGTNTLVMVATPLQKVKEWDSLNTDPGVVQIKTPAGAYSRKLFNGLAQVIVKKDGSGKPLVLQAIAPKLQTATLTIK